MSIKDLRRRIGLPLSVAVAITAGLAASQQTVQRPGTANPGSAAAQIDALLAAAYPSDRPGAAAIVVKDGKPILRKGYGLAEVELNVPIEPDMIFRVGSVTKQFTSTAILMLADRGKLTVGDPITKFLPDYPTQGKTITIEHLLTHTSGIKSYTGMAAWRPLMMKDLSVAEMIDVFKNEPMDFAPGERWLYDNSGYFLLGAIIEKVSGKTYEEFIQQEIFTPLGMTHSFYGNHARIIPRRVPGYEKRGGNTYVNAAYLSMTQPYAAGSLLSSVDDLAKWDAAIAAGTLLPASAYQKMFTAYKLSSGKSTGYGYGWSIASYEGHSAFGHSGGINGFVCHVLRMPEDRLYVAVLSNNASNDANPGELAQRAAAIAIGKPVTDPPAIVMDAGALDVYAGTYQGDGARRVITREGSRLFMTGAGPRVEIIPASPALFFVKGSMMRVTFDKDASGKIVRLTAGGWGSKETFIRAE